MRTKRETRQRAAIDDTSSGAGRDAVDRESGARFRSPARLVGAQPSIKRRRSILILTGLSLLMTCLIFPDVGWWPLAYVCLVPWLICVCTCKKSRFIYFASFLFGLGFFHFNVRWLYPVTPPGYFALCTYYAIFFPLAAWPIRHMYSRHGTSVAIVAPIVWVATEYLRTISAVGFPWLFMGHTQYTNVTLIQVSDLVGAYGVSFMVVMINGWLTDLLIQPILIWRTDKGARLPIGSLSTLLVVLGVAIYGSTQRSQKVFTQGPRVAVIQHDFPMFVSGGGVHPNAVFQSYEALTRQAAAEKPDIIVLPETAINGNMNDGYLDAGASDLEEIRRRRYGDQVTLNGMKQWQAFSRDVRDAFQKISNEFGVPILIGSLSMEWKPSEIVPRADAYNSAFLLLPEREKPVARYDKVHIVLFGEYVPFRYSDPELYNWLNSLTPWGAAGVEYSLSAGAAFDVFEFHAASQRGKRYRAAAPICYEEIMPYVTRAFVRGDEPDRGKKNIDMLLSMSNDGWFLHSAELEQHLAGAVFRAVENRIPIARSVNTGCSAFIHPNGKIHLRVQMSDEKLERLDRVIAAMEQLDDTAQSMESRLDTANGFLESLAEAGQNVQKDLIPAIDALGVEFAYLIDQLPITELASLARTDDPAKRAERFDQMREKLSETLETVRRWRDKPWMAPAHAVEVLKCDERSTLYTWWGDWFAQGALVLMCMMLADWTLRQFRRLQASDKTKEGHSR